MSPETDVPKLYDAIHTLTNNLILNESTSTRQLFYQN